MTTQIEDLLEDQEIKSCFYCNEHSADYTVVSVMIMRKLTFAEARSRYYPRLDFVGPLTESVQEAVERYANESWTHEYVDRVSCPDCTLWCEWCEEPYVTPRPSDNTFDSGGSQRLRWSHSETICRGCADDSYTCDSCGEPVHSDHTYHTTDEFAYCMTCYEDVSYYCENCDETYGSSDHERQCRYMPRRIKNYSHKPDPEFQAIVEVDGDLSDYQKLAATPFLGVELEIECKDGYIDDALDILEAAFGEKAYYKEDGSISYGFEIVTHPMTLEAHKRLVDWSFGNKLSAIGCRSWNTSTCGLHVHISRSAFRGNVHMAMFQHLIINNHIEMARLAGRDSERWASFHGVRGEIQKRIKGERYANRYEAVNTLPEDTIEVRMFKGSLKSERILMALELVDAAFHYTKHIGANAYMKTERLHFYYFAQWVRGNEKYRNLNDYIDHYQLMNNLPAGLAQVEEN